MLFNKNKKNRPEDAQKQVSGQQATGKLSNPTGPTPNPRNVNTTEPVPRPDFNTNDRMPSGHIPPVNMVEAQKAESKGRKALLVILPIVALALVVVLVVLIYSLPKEQEIRMQRETIESQLRATQPTSIAPQPTIPAEKLSPAQPRDFSKIKMEDVASLIKTGAGISPGMQFAPPVMDPNPQRVVWKSPVAYRYSESASPPPVTIDSNMPAVVNITETSIEPEQTSSPQETLVGQSIEETSLAEPSSPDQDLAQETSSPLLAEPPLGQQVEEYSHLTGGFIHTNVNAWIYSAVVNVRASDSMDAEIMTELNAGDSVWELETNGSWSHVLLADGSDGYIYTSLLSYNFVPKAEEIQIPDEVIYTADEFEPYYGTLYSKFSGLNIRKEPSTTGEILGTMYYGDHAEAIGFSGGWFKIQWYDGEVAYVHGDYLTDEVISAEEAVSNIQHEEVQYVATDWQTVETPANLAGGNAIVNTAMQYVGSAYVYGGTSPSSGFDCSGFAQYVYGLQGVSLSRTTYDQVHQGIDVPFGYKDFSNMVPGDLVFFGAGTNVYHVGIYIGGGQMVHAGNSSTGVVVDSLNLDYWAGTMAKVKRIFY